MKVDTENQQCPAAFKKCGCCGGGGAVEDCCGRASVRPGDIPCCGDTCLSPCGACRGSGEAAG